MSKPKKAFWWDESYLYLNCVIQTKSGKDELAGLHGDEVKIKIVEIPQDGKANKHLIEFLSSKFAVKKSSIALLKGLTSNHKLIRVEAPKVLPSLFNP